MKPFFKLSFQGIIFLLLVATLAGCDSLSPDDSSAVSTSATCDDLRAIYAGRQPVDRRVEESGLSVTFTVHAAGCKGQDLPIKLFAVDAAGMQTFLAEKTVKATYDSSEWKDLDLFVPLSRFYNIQPTTQYIVYVQSPDNPQGFIGKSTFTLNSPFQPNLIWSWKAWQDEVSDADGDPGLQISMQLEARGYNGSQFQSVIILEDSNGNALKAADGSSPLVVTGQALHFIYDDSLWQNLVFNIQYHYLSSYYPGLTVYARPGLKLDNGQLVGGNVYCKFLAGGSANTVLKNFKNDSDTLKQEIQNTEDQLNALKETNP
jgi:hypothetical protein